MWSRFSWNKKIYVGKKVPVAPFLFPYILIRAIKTPLYYINAEENFIQMQPSTKALKTKANCSMLPLIMVFDTTQHWPRFQITM